MKTTRYFERRSYGNALNLQREWCEGVLHDAVRREVQPDGRIRHWIFVPELGKYLRVVTLEDGETVHNAFPDRDFEEELTVKFRYYPETDSLYIDLSERKRGLSKSRRGWCWILTPRGIW